MKVERSCDSCVVPYQAQRSTSRYCSERCRKRGGRRERASQGQTAVAVLAEYSPLVKATRAELERVGMVDSCLGQQAMALAVRMVNSFDTGSPLAALSREFRAVLAEVKAGTHVTADAVDEIKTRRDAKLASVPGS